MGGGSTLQGGGSTLQVWGSTPEGGGSTSQVGASTSQDGVKHPSSPPRACQTQAKNVLLEFQEPEIL